jgi:hypothetical protein
VSKIFRASGISLTRTAVPACLQPTMTDEPKTDMLNAQKEAKMVIGQIVTDVLDKTSELQSWREAVSAHAGLPVGSFYSTQKLTAHQPPALFPRCSASTPQHSGSSNNLL